MRTCAAYHLDYNVTYKNINKDILNKIVRKVLIIILFYFIVKKFYKYNNKLFFQFKFRIKELNPPIPLGYNNQFAYELLKKHVQYICKY